MKRSLALSTGSALAATAVGVTGFLVAGGSAGAQATAQTGAHAAAPSATAAAEGKLLICHKGLGKFKALNSSMGIEGLESGRAISGTHTGYDRAPRCRPEGGVDERTRIAAHYRAKSPFRLKSVSVQQSDGAKVTLTHNSRGLRIVMSPGDEVSVTYRWVRPKKR